MSELLHLLPSSYLTKETTIKILSDFEVYSKHLKYSNVKNFLDETIFLDCQENGKSQKVLNGIINDALQLKFKYKIEDCGRGNIKNWFYVDDVLASGKTFKDDLIEKINEYGVERFKEANIQIIAPFIILHQWGKQNLAFAIEKKIGIKLNIYFFQVKMIENYPYINKYNNPKFNHIYPLKTDFGVKVLEFIEKACDRNYNMSNSNFAFRDSNYPLNESFFSNTENRIRYENIMLSKGIEIMERIGHINVPSLRPLGMTPPSYKTLGTGSHIITWRNISGIAK